MSSYCVVCDRSFDSNRSLEQHNQNSPAHVFNCAPCNRRYRSSRALQQHVRDSVAHALPSEHVLQQHLQDSPAPAPARVQSFDCETCGRHYGSEAALEQHLRDSPIHQQNTETPLDVFFRTFLTFDYDPSLPPATSYSNLQKHQGWRRGNTASRDAWERYQDALQDELRLWFGAENDLIAWHALCRAIGIDPLPETCEQCERVGNSVTKVGRSMLTWIIGCTENVC